LVTRRRDPDDERVVLIALTEAGQRLRSKAKRVPVGIACSAGFDPTDERDRLQIARLRRELAELTDRINATAQKNADGR
jgi:MarR family transcriptional regulator, organic hydroperoxide resistance regulator